MPTGDLVHYATGKGPFGKRFKRTMEEAAIAKRQLELRRAGGAIVRGTLRTMGYVWTGTGGWHIIPMISMDNRIGFVDSARGMAVLTEQTLAPEGREALTTPNQGEGVKASGAAAWSSPDVGEGWRASAPAGWVQLVTDIRTFADKSHSDAYKVDIPQVRWRVHAFGLKTCYSGDDAGKAVGFPGLAKLDGGFEMPKWGTVRPMPREAVAALDAVAIPWLIDVCRRLATMAGMAAEIHPQIDAVLGVTPATPLMALAGAGSPRIGAGAPTKIIQEFYTRRRNLPFNSIEQTLDLMATAHLPGSLTNRATAESGIGRVAHSCSDADQGMLMPDSGAVIGCRWLDLAKQLIAEILFQKILPVAKELVWMNPTGEHHSGELQRKTLLAVGEGIYRTILAPFAFEADEIINKKLPAAYYSVVPAPVYPGETDVMTHVAPEPVNENENDE